MIGFGQRRWALGLLVAVLLSIVGFRLSPPTPSYQGKPIRHWLAQLDVGADEAAVEEAQTAFRTWGTPAVPALIREMQITDVPFVEALAEWAPAVFAPRWNQAPAREWHARAAHALSLVGPAARAAVPVLWQAMQEGDDTRRQATATLAQLHAQPDLLVPGLIATLADTNTAQTGMLDRLDAADNLGRFGAAARDAVPHLLAALRDLNHPLRLRAALALNQIDPATARTAATPVLIELLNDAKPRLAAEAALALNKIDPALGQTRVIPHLVSVLRRPTDELKRVCAGEALLEIAPQTQRSEVFAAWTEILGGADPLAAFLAAENLHHCEPTASRQNVIPALIRLLDRPYDAQSGYITNLTTRLLARINPPTAAGRPGLRP